MKLSRRACTPASIERAARDRYILVAEPTGIRPPKGQLEPMSIYQDMIDPAARLRDAGLRPTRQRVALADLLFAKGDRHLTAEELHEVAVLAGLGCSLATVYNTLHQFTDAGLLRVLSLETAKTYFDTNISDHHHFVVDGSTEVLDVPDGSITVGNLPVPPEGMEISHVDVVIRLRPKR